MTSSVKNASIIKQFTRVYDSNHRVISANEMFAFFFLSAGTRERRGGGKKMVKGSWKVKKKKKNGRK